MRLSVSPLPYNLGSPYLVHSLILEETCPWCVTRSWPIFHCQLNILNLHKLIMAIGIVQQAILAIFHLVYTLVMKSICLKLFICHLPLISVSYGTLISHRQGKHISRSTFNCTFGLYYTQNKCREYQITALTNYHIDEISVSDILPNKYISINTVHIKASHHALGDIHRL